ncbi:unnamed protein product [Fusarium equiseti]|uniref:Ankyrin repeat protein n=1 Tax=Fusarium equiseti TaxID=61235 RepID=A0A8J2IPC4_FUSEQ|nr:unnamed protein product [Fusarium equiseti]
MTQYNTVKSEPVLEYKPICEYKTSEVKVPEFKPTCEFKTSEFNSSGFTSTEFQEGSKAAEKPTCTITEEDTSPDGEMARSIVKVEARFENKQTGHSIWKVGRGLLVSPHVVVAESEIVYDAEYQLGAATQIKCCIGNRGRNVSETQPRYGKSVRFSAEWIEGHNRRSRDIPFIKVATPSVVSSSQQTASEEKPTVSAVTHCCNCSGHADPVPAVVAEPVVEPVVEAVLEAEPEPEVIQPEIPVTVCVKPVQEPMLKPILKPELEIPAPATQPDCEFVQIEAEAPVAKVDNTPDTSIVEEAEITDHVNEALKSVSQLDNKTFDIESSLIDDVSQFVSVATSALVSYVVGAETISNGAATELPSVPERALLAEASPQAVLAIKQSDELDEIIASMKTNWTANAPQIDQLSELLEPYLPEAAKYVVENHQQNYTAQVAVKPLQRRSLEIRDFESNASTQAFVKGLFEPSLPLAGREAIFSSLGPVLCTAVSNAQQIVNQAGKMTIGLLKHQYTMPRARKTTYLNSTTPNKPRRIKPRTFHFKKHQPGGSVPYPEETAPAFDLESVSKALSQGWDPNTSWIEDELVFAPPGSGCVMPTSTDPWSHFNTPLHRDLFQKQFDVAQLLLDHGAGIELLNASGRTVLHGAIDQGTNTHNRGWTETTEWIVGHGANLDKKTEDRTVVVAKQSHTGKSRDYHRSGGISPSRMAITLRDLTKVQHLAKAGADVNLPLDEEECWYPIDVAFLRRQMDMVEVLENAGASFSKEIENSDNDLEESRTLLSFCLSGEGSIFHSAERSNSIPPSTCQAAFRSYPTKIQLGRHFLS